MWGSSGCNVVTAPCCSSAVSRLRTREKPPDVIISDYRLGKGETGIGAIAGVRNALAEDIPAFLISGDTAPERQLEARATGFHLLHKPVSPMALRATLNRMLQSSGQPAGVAEPPD